jgi:hypothetical protein
MERHRWGLHLFVEFRRHPFNMHGACAHHVGKFTIANSKLANDFNATLTRAPPDYKHY